ncbi:MAG: PEPxxWA-CTERM sorting domain-containing protein [Pseudomonadota bacterium]
MNRLMITAAIALGLFATQPASASTIIDTGPGPSEGGGFTLSPNQSLAAEFDLTQDYTITSVEGWISTLADESGFFSASIFSDDGDVPGTVLFSSQFEGPTLLSYEWRGVYDLDWSLAAGSYWVVFSGEPGSRAFMPFPSPNPLDNGAFKTDGPWVAEDNIKIGVRIRGAVAPIPEPSAWAMLLLGLGAVGGALRFAKRKHNVTVSLV